ncbi:porin family protein [Cesiribacter sp. SM1]|uniref:porin family protein n=1 Tax=Cesiribacter sp. SM1 TaxID=2861196 RepID=UPI001CD4BD28|nr:porin family protein [Cesiribacter sp. SM1]
MRKIFFTLFLMLLTTASVFAQAQVGLRAGANWATVIREQDPPAGVETPWRPGFMVGVATSFGAGEIFSIAPELVFSQRGNNWEEGGVSSSTRYNFLELPVLFRISFGDVLGGYINAGPTFSYLLGGKSDSEDVNFSEIDDPKRWEIGGSLGGGVKLNTGAGTFLIDLRYTRGFSDTFFRDFSGDQESKHQLITTSLIFLIPSVQ